MSQLILFCRQNSPVFIFLALLLGSGIFSQLVTTEYAVEGGRQQISIIAKALLGLSYLLSFSLLVMHWKVVKERWVGVGSLWILLLLWTVVTVMLGQSNVHTVVRLIGFMGCTLMGLMLFVCTDSFTQAMKVMFWVCVAIIGLNISSIDVSILLDISSKNIKGVFYQKNLLGHFSLLMLFVASFVFVQKHRVYRLASVLSFIAAAWLLFLSTSMTSNLLFLIAVSAVSASLIIGYYKNGAKVVMILVLLLTVLLIFNWTDLLALMGKNTTFTGRTFIWSEYWALIQQRPLLGHGYGAYPEQITAWLKLGPHSGYIELVYYIGFIGAAIMVAITVQMLSNWWYVVKNKSLLFEVSFLFGFIVIFLALNITETYMLNRSGLFWPLFVYISLQLAWLTKNQQVENKTP